MCSLVVNSVGISAVNSWVLCCFWFCHPKLGKRVNKNMDEEYDFKIEREINIVNNDVKVVFKLLISGVVSHSSARYYYE